MITGADFVRLRGKLWLIWRNEDGVNCSECGKTKWIKGPWREEKCEYGYGVLNADGTMALCTGYEYPDVVMGRYDADADDLFATKREAEAECRRRNAKIESEV